MVTSNRGAPGLALILARDPVEEQWRLRRGQRLPAEQRVRECGVGVAAQLAADDAQLHRAPVEHVLAEFSQGGKHLRVLRGRRGTDDERRLLHQAVLEREVLRVGTG